MSEGLTMTETTPVGTGGVTVEGTNSESRSVASATQRLDHLPLAFRYACDRAERWRVRCGTARSEVEELQSQKETARKELARLIAYYEKSAVENRAHRHGPNLVVTSDAARTAANHLKRVLEMLDD